MTRFLMSAVVAVVMGAGCKFRGTAELIADFPDRCEPATHAQVYLIPQGTCPCACGDCLARCTGESCKQACGDDLCTVEQLDRGIKLEPEGPGLHTIVFQLLRLREDGLPEVVATACGDQILESDGTMSSTVSVSGQCCVPPLG